MATGGGKPGIMTKATVEAVLPKSGSIVISVEDTSYFKVGDEFMAEFHAIALGDSPGDGGEQGNS